VKKVKQSLDESIFQETIINFLKENKWCVKKEVTDNTGKCRIDIMAYHNKIDCWIGFELKTPQNNADYTKCLTQLIKYRNATFHPSPRLLCLISSFHVEWYHYRYFWRFGFGVGDNSLSSDLNIIFPPNGNQKSTLHLSDLGSNISYHEELTPKKQIEKILSFCILGWRNFGYVE